MAIANTLFTEGRVALGALAGHVAGLDELPGLIEPFTPEAVAPITGVADADIRRLARELSDAPSGSVYDRVGAHQQEFGTLTSWCCDAVNVLTGSGRMFPLAAHAVPDPATPGGRGWRPGRFSSRVKGYREAYGQLPVATLADEIATPGDGQVKALITIAGNPVLSTPNGRRLSQALGSLEFLVSVDPNETTRHANVILPSPRLLARHHYDFAFYGLSVRNVAKGYPKSLYRTLGASSRAEAVERGRELGLI